MKIIITGNPVDGFRYIGPFADDEMSSAVFNYFSDDADWWVANIEPPFTECNFCSNKADWHFATRDGNVVADDWAFSCEAHYGKTLNDFINHYSTNGCVVTNIYSKKRIVIDINKEAQ